MRIGLTGGIGSGKSTVAARLRDAGFVVLDADRVAREVVQPGQPALAAIHNRFGAGVIADDGSLDRAALAGIVFTDEQARADLEAITHPAIHARIDDAERNALEADPNAVVVVDHPLLVETNQVDDFDAIVVVLADAEVRCQRLVDARGMDPDDARNRMAAQAPDDERTAAATWVIDNNGDLASLHDQVDELVHEIRARAGAA